MIQTIDGIQFKQMVLHGAAAITLQKQQINDLNVFPAPSLPTITRPTFCFNNCANRCVTCI